MIVTLKELLEIAKAENKAIGSFTCPNMEIVMGTIRAAEESQSPIIIQIAEGRLKHTPLNMIGPLMVQAAKDASVKIAVHLDHGLTIGKAREALGYGFTSVMFDGSHYSLQENIDKTNEIAKLARQTGASVEAELGTIGGKEATERDEVSKYTDVGEARMFAENADIDALAVAIGNAHGHYKGKPELNFERLAELQKAVNVPLVLHGGSGISDEDFRHCIDLGVRKINIATASMDAAITFAGRYMAEPGEHDYYHFNENMVQGVYENVKHCIKVFNNKEPL
ncbi:fructose-bisphosphate aldolase, class II [Sarcina sp. DSM 11001]|uniref:ketose-bisphosphate aldolase n=1 Tax=Sarcina sp. DSM 11001 TaxID=1798184 RepID=UPI00088FF740|nr:ketose-bisphosphate aldolase [Sarcina sp. DSM 11001]SDL14959.1 fructose-bisphosphate aldolase, class II [Sarcina sp. DSM 11001]